MIRRTVRTAAKPEQWILISQVEHARLAGKLAESWGRQGVAALEPRSELLNAIFHHDDGWADWERSPGLDSKTGRPLQFTEMPLVESLAIWEDSIISASHFGPLAGYVVSGHFCELLRRFSARWKGEEAMTAMAHDFLDSQRQQQTEWSAEWARQPAASEPDVTLANALQFLQLFDSLSLWLCCSETPEPEEFESPGGPKIAVRLAGPGQVAVDPWPFQPESLQLSAVGRSLPASRYDTPPALATAPVQPVTLNWRLLPV